MNIAGKRVRLVKDNKRKREKKKIYDKKVLNALKDL
jgi:hypothetical protein